MRPGRSSGVTDTPPRAAVPSRASGTLSACARVGGLAVSTVEIPVPIARGSKPNTPTVRDGPIVGRPWASTEGNRTSTATVSG